MKALRYDIHIYAFKSAILASLMHHNEALKGLAVKSNMMKVPLLHNSYLFSIISDHLKEWGIKVNKKHERMNWISRLV